MWLFVLLAEGFCGVLWATGFWSLLKERRSLEASLLRERYFLAVRASAAIADDLARCAEAVGRADGSPDQVRCGWDESAFRWFTWPGPQPDAPPREPSSDGLGQRWNATWQAACPGDALDQPACQALLQEMAGAGANLDPVLAFLGAKILEVATQQKQDSPELRALRGRLERILFEDAMRRHARWVETLGAPAAAGAAKGGAWFQLGRYRLSPGENRIFGFDSQPRSDDVRGFLIARGVLEGGELEFRLDADPSLSAGETRSASAAFVDSRVGTLVVEDPAFEDRLARSQRSTDLLLFWFSLAAAVLMLSIALIARSTRRTLETARLRENLVASLSHEFRTPLGGLALMIDTLRAGKLDSEARRQEYLTQMSQECRRLTRLSENLLATGRLQRTRSDSGNAVQLPEVAREALERIRPEAQAKSIELRVSIADGLPPCRGDPDLLQVALINLLDNAIKFAPAGSSVAVDISVRGGELRCAVTDAGPGIPPAEQKKIFDWFYRSENKLTRTTQGTGLGLGIVREVARRHRGRVELSSRPGTGSCFTLVIPVASDRSIQ